MQQLMLIPNPEAAYRICQDFMPECERAVPVSDVSFGESSSSFKKRQSPLSVTSSLDVSTHNESYSVGPIIAPAGITVGS